MKVAFVIPDRKTGVQPAPVLFPSSRRNSVYTHENVSLTKFDRLPAVDERISRRMLREVHRNGVDF
jgi:hypothetical protein